MARSPLTPRGRNILIVGARGRMSQTLQASCKEHRFPFQVWPSDLALPEDDRSLLGIIDFTTADSSLRVLDYAVKMKLALVCGTTGWIDSAAVEKKFKTASKVIQIVKDSNFSHGIEIFCQLSELMGKKTGAPLSLIDLHHDKKKDAPSGTALKIKRRVESASRSRLELSSIRLGDIPGEHRLLLSFHDQTIEITHRAHSRRPFAEGAIFALKWVLEQKPGLYSMEDIFR